MKTTNPRFNRLVARYYPAVFHLAATFSKSPTEAVALTRRTFAGAAATGALAASGASLAACYPN